MVQIFHSQQFNIIFLIFIKPTSRVYEERKREKSFSRHVSLVNMFKKVKSFSNEI